MSLATAMAPARLLVFLAALLAAVGLLISLGTSTATAAKPCWERVIDDWIDNGRIDGVYSPACLQAALTRVPEDVRAYSDFEDRVKQSRQDAFRELSSKGPSGSGPSTRPSRQVQRVEEIEPNASAPRDKGPITSVLSVGTSDAQSVPLPLIVLTGLALLLLAAGAAGVAQRKLAARRARSR